MNNGPVVADTNHIAYTLSEIKEPSSTFSGHWSGSMMGMLLYLKELFKALLLKLIKDTPHAPSNNNNNNNKEK